MKKINNKQKLYTVIGATVALIFGVLVFFIVPTYQTISELQQAIHDKQVELASFQQQRENIEQTRRDYNEIKNDINNISKTFIVEDDLVALISTLETLAADSAITQSLDIEGTGTDTIGTKLNIKLKLTGELPDVVAYLAMLERLDYYVVMPAVDILDAGDEVTLSTTASIYQQP